MDVFLTLDRGAFLADIHLDDAAANETNEADLREVEKYNLIKDIVYIMGATLLMVIGIPGNIITLMIMKGPAMRDGLFSTYLSSLCFWNILVLIWCVPRFIVQAAYDREVLIQNFAFCVVYRLFTILLVVVTNWYLVVISVIRLCFIFDRNKRYIKYYGSPVKVLVSVTIAVFVLDTPMALLMIDYSEHEGAPDKCHICTDTIFAILQLTIQGFVPTGLLLILNAILIFMHFGKHSRLVENKSTQRLRKQLVLLVSLSCLHYIITYFPFAAILPNLHRIFDLKTPLGQAKSRLWYGVILMMLYSNNGTNFLAYAVFGKRFRKAWCDLMREWHLVRPRPPGDISGLFDTSSKYTTESASASVDQADQGHHTTPKEQSESFQNAEVYQSTGKRASNVDELVPGRFAKNNETANFLQENTGSDKSRVSSGEEFHDVSQVTGRRSQTAGSGKSRFSFASTLY